MWLAYRGDERISISAVFLPKVPLDTQGVRDFESLATDVARFAKAKSYQEHGANDSGQQLCNTVFVHCAHPYS